MEKIDLKKTLKQYYNNSAQKPSLITLPEMNFLMIDGKGDPNTSSEYQHAIEALYALFYAIKFKIKKGDNPIDFSVMPLEGLWWTDDMNDFSIDRKEDWNWTMMIMQPDFVSKEIVELTKEEVKNKKNPPALSKIKLKSYNEGNAAQVMHLGPFSEEGPTIAGLHKFIDEQDFSLNGLHHEVYLSDIRRAAPEKWRTIIRQPYK